MQILLGDPKQTVWSKEGQTGEAYIYTTQGEICHLLEGGGTGNGRAGEEPRLYWYADKASSSSAEGW
jgi:hypothetical protein